MLFLIFAFRFIYRLLALLALALVVLCGWLWVQHNRTVILPVPPGVYPVGRVEYDWTDPSRIDPLADVPDQKRTLNVWIWYPAQPGPGERPASYLPQDWLQARQDVVGVGSLLSQNFARVQPHAFENPPLAANEQLFPVLVMQPGLGPLISDYTSLAEALASQGYVVVGINPTYSSSVVVFEDGRKVFSTPAGSVPDNASPAEAHAILDRLIKVWAADDQFIIDRLEQLDRADPDGRFTKRLDLQAVGLLGHSFGGATAAQVCAQDSRCKAGADMDGYPYGTVVQDGLHQPFMFVWSEPLDAGDAEWQQARQDTRAIAARWPHDQVQIMVNGMRHFNFSDYAVGFAPVLRLMGELGPIDGRRGLEITEQYLLGFFDRYLRHRAVPLLDGPSSAYPEVQFELH